MAAGRKGGIASQAKQRQNKTLAEIMIRFSNSEIKNETLKAEMKSLGFTDTELQNKTAVGLGLFKKAIMGDVNAYKEYMALIEEQKKEETLNVNVKTSPLEKMTEEELLNHLNMLEGKDNNGTDDNETTDN